MFDLLGDDYVRDILRATSTEPKGVREMSQELDVARSTIYRRVDTLVDFGLLREQTRAAKDGNHHAVYEAVVDRLTIEIEDGELDCELHPSDDASTRFTKLWDGMRDS
jgi:predicted transcriptional regulator